jgi:putative addiction module component (TIGR02574 family)
LAIALQGKAVPKAATFTRHHPNHCRLESIMQTAKQLCDQALQLSPEERMALVDQILDTLDERDSALDAQWAQEAQSRLAAYRRGEAQAIPLTEVIAKYQVKRHERSALARSSNGAGPGDSCVRPISSRFG